MAAIPADSDTVEFSTTLTTEDWVEFAIRNTRAYLVRQRRRGLVGALLLLIVAALIGVTAGSLLADGRLPTYADVLLFVTLDRTRLPLLVWLILTVGFFVVRYAVYERLVRRRHRRWALAEHGAEPIPTRYRLDATGLTVSDRDCCSHKHWAGIAGLEETATSFFIIDALGQATPVPKHDLAGADQDRLRAIVMAHKAGASGSASALPQAEIAGEGVLVRFDQNAGDRAATSLMAWNTPARRRRRGLAIAAMAFGVAAALIGLDAFGWLVERREDGDYDTIGDAFRAYLEAELPDAWRPAACAAAFGLLLWALLPWLLRRQAWALARTRGDIPILLAFGNDGITTATPTTELHCAWSGVRAVSEGPSHIFLRLALSMIIPVPKRALDPAALAAVRDLLRQHVRGA